VFRLMASSYFVGVCTGRSAGFSPLEEATEVTFYILTGWLLFNLAFAMEVFRFLQSGYDTFDLTVAKKQIGRRDFDWSRRCAERNRA
jgi:hypothetical protein